MRPGGAVGRREEPLQPRRRIPERRACARRAAAEATLGRSHPAAPAGRHGSRGAVERHRPQRHTRPRPVIRPPRRQEDRPQAPSAAGAGPCCRSAAAEPSEGPRVRRNLPTSPHPSSQPLAPRALFPLPFSTARSRGGGESQGARGARRAAPPPGVRW